MRSWGARIVSAVAVVLVLGACGTTSLGSNLDASAVPVALAWARAEYVTFDCPQVAALETSDYPGALADLGPFEGASPLDCAENRHDSRSNRVRRVSVAGVLRRLCDPRHALFTPHLPKTDCVRVTVRDVSCGGSSGHHHVVTHDKTVLDVFLKGRGTSWRVSGVLIDTLDSALTHRRCGPSG